LPRISQESGCRAAAEEQMWLLLQQRAPAITAVTRWAKGLKLVLSLHLLVAQHQGLLKQEASCEVYGVYGVLIAL